MDPMRSSTNSNRRFNTLASGGYPPCSAPAAVAQSGHSLLTGLPHNPGRSIGLPSHGAINMPPWRIIHATEKLLASGPVCCASPAAKNQKQRAGHDCPAPECRNIDSRRLTLEVDQITEHLVGGGNNLGTGLKTPLGGDHRNKLGRKVYVGLLQGVGKDLAHPRTDGTHHGNP